MSRFVNNQLTEAGLLLLAKAQMGIPIVYTKILIGDGSIGIDQNIGKMTDVVHPVGQINISKCELDNGKVTVGGPFPYENIREGFYYRELGLFALDPEDGEILYSYGNAGELAEWIPASSGDEVRERYVEIITTTNNATNVSAIINSSMYATIEMLNYYASQTGQFLWDASEILGENTVAIADGTANNENSAVLDNITKSLNGSSVKKKFPFGGYIAIFRIKSNNIDSIENVISCDIMPDEGDVPIITREISPSEFQTADKWTYFKIPFENNSENNAEKFIYPRVRYLSGSAEIRIDNVLIASDILAIM